MVKPYSEAQKRANQKWSDENKDRRRYLSYRSSARGFIRNHSTIDDLDELEALIAERRKELEQ